MNVRAYFGFARLLATVCDIRYDCEMKIWIKLLIGSALGIVFGIVAPENEPFLEVLALLERFVLQLGRYALVPVLFFSLAIATHELLKDKRFWPIVVKNIMLIASVSFFVIVVGVLATLAMSPARIPIMAEEQIEAARLDVAQSAMELFPSNMFAVFSGDGSFLLPLYLFAFFLGMSLSYDKTYSRPVINLIDSLSRIFFHISSFFIEILGFMMIVLSAYWAIRFRGAWQTGVFGELIVMLAVIAGILGFVILPLALCLLKPRPNPFAAAYGSLGPAIAAFFSGDVNFTLLALIRHGRESFGIKRRSSALTLAMFATFCRGGSAMVAAAAFIVIFKSYSSIGISAVEVILICFQAFAVSFLLARHPGSGAYAALAVLCLGFGRGFEDGYLILRPVAFYLIGIGTFLDVMIASLANYAMAKVNGYAEDKSMGQYI